MRFSWKRFVDTSTSNDSFRSYWILSVAGLAGIIVAIFTHYYSMVLFGIGVALLPLPLLVPRQPRVECDQEWVVVQPRTLYANLPFGIAVSFLLMMLGAVLQMWTNNKFDLRLTAIAVGSPLISLFFLVGVVRSRGGIRLSPSAIVARGRGPFGWDSIEIRYGDSSNSSPTIGIYRSGTENDKLAAFNSASYNVDFNTLLSTLVQVKDSCLGDSPIGAAMIRAMILTPPPDPLPPVGQSVEIPVVVDDAA